MTPGDPPYRSQELRAPEAPLEPWWPNLKRLLTIVALSVCCGPTFYLFVASVSWLVLGLAGGAVAFGLVVAVRGVARRAPRLVWRGVTISVAATLVMGFPVDDHCAKYREKQLIAAVHTWRAAHGSYPDSLAVLPPTPRSALCRVPRLPNLMSGHIRYFKVPNEDDADLTYTHYGYSRRIYHFRARRFTYLD